MASGFGLLGRLPGELRDRIYEHVATDTVIWIERNVRRPRDWIRGSEALLRTSRRIRAEFFPILKRQAVYAADIIHNVSFNRGYRTPDPPIELLWNVRALALSIRFCDGKHFHSANMGDVLGASNSLRAWRAVRDAMPDMLTRTRRLTLVLKGYIGWPGYEKENQYTRATLECLPRLQYYDVEIFGERYCAYRCPEEGVWKDEEPSTVYNWQDERESLNVFWDRK